MRPQAIAWHFYKELNSTQIQALNLHKLCTSSNDMTVVVSDQQSAGRGQYGRQWMSKKGNIYLSAAFIWPTPHITTLRFFTLLAGATLFKCLKAVVPFLNLTLKWPNDLVIKHENGMAKIAGLISERKANNICVLGLGLNSFGPYPKDIGTSLFDLSVFSDEFFNQEFSQLFISQLSQSLNTLWSKGSSPLIQFLEKKAMAGFWGTLGAADIPGSGLQKARAVGLNDNGLLKVETEPDGAFQFLEAGQFKVSYIGWPSQNLN